MVGAASSSTSKVCIHGKSEDFVEKIAPMGGGGGGGGAGQCPGGQMWLLLLLFYCSPHLYVNKKTAEGTCIYKLMLLYVQIGFTQHIQNSFQYDLSSTYTVTGTCKFLWSILFYRFYKSLSVCVFLQES